VYDKEIIDRVMSTEKNEYERIHRLLSFAGFGIESLLAQPRKSQADNFTN